MRRIASSAIGEPCDRWIQRIAPRYLRHRNTGRGRLELARSRAFDMPFLEAGIELFQEGGLLGGDLDRLPACAVSSASQRSMRVPSPLSLRIFWMVIADTRTPSSASVASCRLQP